MEEVILQGFLPAFPNQDVNLAKANQTGTEQLVFPVSFFLA